ncbi:general substrate transporter [Stachybotrys elegans]|uniref:General substrate transporter n=1 Tax=Stachybotrys elegans TaxID=80388 RepID=A0A8K0WUC7_9HYPO|nr:general substrate transporter [Stachybotrys elegans]
MGWRGKKLQAGITLCCLSAFILFGYEQGVFGPIIENEDWLDQFNHPSDTHTGIIVSSYNLGCLLGCILNFVIGEWLGRRKVIWLAMSFVLVGTTLQISSYNVAHLVVGRIITGLGTGLKTSTVPAYQSELCAPNLRGRLISAETLFVGVGIVVAYWFDYGMSFVGGSIAWRLPVSMQAVFAVGVIGLVFGLPESPRWLYNHGREQEAIQVLCDIYDMHPEDPVIVAEAAAIRQAVAMELEIDKSFWAAFRNDEMRTGYRVFLAWLAQFMNQMCGINLVVYYIPTVLRTNVGMERELSKILGGFIQMMFMFGSLLPTFTLDTLGRRKTMVWGCAGLGFSMLMVAALLSQADGGETTRGTNFASASVAFFFLYMLIFGASVNSVPWVYVPELLPLNARTQGTAIGVSSNWLWNFTVAMITPIIINRLEWKAYLIFTATNIMFIPMVYFLYPETSNLSLEEIDLIFKPGVNPVKASRELIRGKQAGLELHIIEVAVASSGSK